jgi:hypothetical protein
MVFHNHQIIIICKETIVGVNGIVFLFNPTTSNLAMGMTTQRRVVHFVVKETIWGSSHGCRILKEGHG